MKTQELNDMKSAIRNPQSAIVSPVYFPFTFISPSLVEAMSLCFRRAVVYQPAYSKPQEALRPWMDRGFLDVRSPSEKVIDKKLIEQALRNFRNWGLLHEHADMTYLKMVGNDIPPIDPKTARIVSDIKGTAAKGSQNPEDSELFLQVFLHLAQEFDEHSWELKQQMNQFDNQYQALRSFFCQDQIEQAHDPISSDQSACAGPASPIDGQAPQMQAGQFPVIEDDPGRLMIEKRMTAWNHLFQKDSTGSGLLFTDSPLALAYLLDGIQGKAEVLKFNITYKQAVSGEVPKNHPILADHIQKIFDAVLTTQWSQTLQESVIEAGRQIEAEICRLRGSAVGTHDRSVSFCWYVLPHEVARTFLNRRSGVDSGREEDGAAKVKNTLVGLIEYLVSSATS